RNPRGALQVTLARSSLVTLKFGPLGDTTMHLCVDMQRLFAEETEWHTPWMDRVIPQVIAITERHREHTVFTRFIPLRDPDDGHGTWRRYYERWPRMTLNQLPDGMIDLMPDL